MFQFDKSSIRNVLKNVIVFVLVIPIVALNCFSGANTAYFKNFFQKLSFLAYPNKNYNYYLYDANGGTSGSYDNVSSITQTFKNRASTKETIYQIKIPVVETGYFNLSFMVDFIESGTVGTELECVREMQYIVGCKVVHESTHPFGKSTSKLDLLSTDSVVATNGMYLKNSSHPVWNADDNFMWKTLAPSLAERVNLTYKVTSADVAKGYVIWAWQFAGFVASTTYTIYLTEISTRKIENDATGPYFDFSQTKYVNNAINTSSSLPSIYGYTRHAPCKGTYVTEASENSLTMQIAPLYAGWNSSGTNETTLMSGCGYMGSDSKDGRYQNLVGLSLPLKNVKLDVSYKVSFDLSIARQGTVDTHRSTVTQADVLYSDDYGSFFYQLADDNNNRTLHFQSYLHEGYVNGRSIDYHSTERQDIKSEYARYSPHEVTRYDEIRQLHAGDTNTDMLHNTSGAINHFYTSSGSNIKFHNAVRHQEIDGQTTINWLTFYNTTFNFNISSSLNSGVDLNNLYWVWAIDALRPGRWFRFKFENVRIEPIEQFGGNVNKNGIKIAGTQVSGFNAYSSGQTEETFLRGASGSGQNYQALQGTTRADNTTTPGIPMAGINTYGPIYDASGYILANGSYDADGNYTKGENDYKIAIDGYCVVKGGVNKYVWSADNGKTWHDMIVETPLSAADASTAIMAERRVDQAQVATFDTAKYYARRPTYYKTSLFTETSGTGGYHAERKDHLNDYVDFTANDSANAMFTGFRIYADISAYANVWDLDVIFAAVPENNPDGRCEILRITNLNQPHAYRNIINDVASDIEVTDTYGNYGDSATAKYFNMTKDTSSAWATSCYNVAMNNMVGIAYGVGATYGAGYASTTSPDSFAELTPTMTGIPIKSTIRLMGWNVCKGGTEGYYWSVDNGLTWKKCDGTPVVGSATNSTIVNQVRYWMNGHTITTADVANAFFNTTASALYIDLSEFEGNVVNLIVAAKPVGNAQFCPVAKINSISVYGERLFFTRYDSITVNGTSVDGLLTYDNLKLNTTIVKPSSYSIYEPYNVDVFAARKLTNYSVDVNSGDLIKVDGFIHCLGGVKHYQYTLDGGQTWTVIDVGNIANGTQFIGPSVNMLKVAAMMCIDFDETSASNGNFSSGQGASDDRKLQFNLPTLTANNKYNLLVVAVANDGNNTMYPVINLPINAVS